MKRAIALILLAGLLLAACPTLGESRPRVILYTAYRQIGWGDAVQVGCVDERGGLWTLSGSAADLNWPMDATAQPAYLARAALEPAGDLDSDALFELKSLIAGVDAQTLTPVPVADDAGIEASWALTYGPDGDSAPILLGTSGDEVCENADPDAQALYVWLRAAFPGVTHFDGAMGPAGFAPVPVSALCHFDAQAVAAAASVSGAMIDCEIGPIDTGDGLESARDIAVNGVVTGKVNGLSVTGGTTVYSFADADGSFVGSIELYRGLLVRPDGMYAFTVD